LFVILLLKSMFLLSVCNLVLSRQVNLVYLSLTFSYFILAKLVGELFINILAQ